MNILLHYDLDFTKNKRTHRYYEIGSGEITWHNHLKLIGELFPYVIMATGASNFNEVEKAMTFFKSKVVLMQCNTNYTAFNGEDLDHERKAKMYKFKSLKTLVKIFLKQF